MLYEYRVYEAMPGKLDELHARFRDHTLDLFEKHGIRNIGYWTVDVGDANDRLIYIVAFDDASPARARMGLLQRRPRVAQRRRRVRGQRQARRQDPQLHPQAHRLLPPPVARSEAAVTPGEGGAS